MATPSAATLAIRDAHIGDAFAVTQMLSTALADSSLGRWLDPDSRTRRSSLLGLVGGSALETIGSGIVRIVEDGGKVVGAALWSLCSETGGPAAVAPADSETGDPVVLRVQRRRRRLDQLADHRCPRPQPHHRLTYLGVRSDRQGQGIGSYLLISHHALLHVTGTPAFLLADGVRSRDLFERHGYTDIGSFDVFPGGGPVWGMWRSPSPADPH